MAGELSLVEARAKAWQLGIVAPWYLRPSQLDLYFLIQEQRFPFIEASRRFGKTTSKLAFVAEKLLKHPGWVCRWCCPEQKQARTIVKPIMDKLMATSPEPTRFKWMTTDSVYVGPQDQMIYLIGVNDNAESARGPASNIIVADEYGSWKEPEYVCNDILSPQLQGQEGQWFIKGSTPPRDLDHVYYREKEVAIRKGRYVKKVIYDNESLTEAELQEIIEECGGVNSTTFRREYLCEEVSDAEILVIPEWSEQNIVPDDYPRPDYFDAYVAGDSGADDNTFITFAYYDFLKDEVIVEDEICINGQTSRQIVESAKSKERLLWGSKPPYRRVYDADKQLLIDIMRDHHYAMTFPRKEDKVASIHELRLRVGSRKLKAKAHCKNLIRQMRVGMWKDEKHTDFQRTASLGHLDGIAAALYLNRSIDKTHNPWPQNMGLSVYSHFIPDPTSSSEGKNEKALLDVFGGPRGLKGL